MAVVFIPTTLRKFAGGRTTVQVEAATVGDVIDKLETEYPGIRDRLVNPDEDDRLRPGLVTFVDGETSTEGLRRKLTPNAEVHFLPAIGGGAGPSGTNSTLFSRSSKAPSGILDTAETS